MQTSTVFAVFLLAASAVVGAEPSFVRPFESRADVEPQGKIDKLVFGRLQELEIQPANLCSDEVFVRRVYLDVIGTLPTLQETKRFLQNSDPNKRRAMIERLLARDEFADYWALKWCDLLRVKAEFPINLWPNAVQAYHRWIRTCVRDDMPYDQFVREMLTASGSNFRVPQVNFYRALQDKQPSAIARAVALAFMGTRVEKWPEDRLSGMAVFFSRLEYKKTAEWKEEIVFFDAVKNAADAPDRAAATALFPDGKRVRLAYGVDPRVAFADWLIAPENPWFARNAVNRVWYWLFGRGIVHEPDDIRPDNPPRHPELLAWLARELVESEYDLKHIYRLILNSKTYQLSSIPRTDHPQAQDYFACYPLRRLDAEVLIDALCQITGTTEVYSSPIPEPFTFIPENQRAISLADGSITSPFLEMFGRPPRDTGLQSERNNRITAAQQLHLLNSTHIRLKIEQSQRLRLLVQSGRRPRDTVNNVYLTVLSRLPTEDELKVLREYVESGEVPGREVLFDLVWALITSSEFLHRH